MDINKLYNFILNEININGLENEIEIKLVNEIKNMNINNQSYRGISFFHSLKFGNNKSKTFNIKFIGEEDFLIKRIKQINFV